MAGEEGSDPTEQQVHQRTAPSRKIVYKAILREADDELERSSSSLAWSGLAAGLSMSFSFIAESILRGHLPEAHWRPLVAKLGYSVGVLVVILGRQQLFTENTLKPVLPLLLRKDNKTLTNMLRLWGVVLAANLLGAWLMAISSRRRTTSSARKCTTPCSRSATRRCNAASPRCWSRRSSPDG